MCTAQYMKANKINFQVEERLQIVIEVFISVFFLDFHRSASEKFFSISIICFIITRKLFDLCFE